MRSSVSVQLMCFSQRHKNSSDKILIKVPKYHIRSILFYFSTVKPGEEGVPLLTSSELAEFENNPLVNQVDFIWSTQTVAAGDTAVLHCSFDAIFQQLRNGMVSFISYKIFIITHSR